MKKTSNASKKRATDSQAEEGRIIPFGEPTIPLRKPTVDKRTNEWLSERKKDLVKDHWKDRYIIWTCVCIWTDRDYSEEWMRKCVFDIASEADMDTVASIRSFTQWNKTRRYEAYLDGERNALRLMELLGKQHKEWRIKIHTNIELRVVKAKRRKWRRHRSHFSVMSWNVRGLNQKFFGVKRELEKYRPTIIALQETNRVRAHWKVDQTSFRMGEYVGFEVRTQVKNQRSCRGLVLALDTRANLTLERVGVDEEASNFMIFGLVSGFVTREKVIVGNIYIPHRERTATLALINKSLVKIRNKYPTEEILLIGDWNMDCESLLKNANQCLTSMQLNMVKVINSETFHRGEIPISSIDHALMSENMPQPQSRTIHNVKLSDHWPLIIWWNADDVKRIGCAKKSQIRMDANKINLRKEKIAFHNYFEALSKEEDHVILDKLEDTSWSVAKSDGVHITAGGGSMREVNKTREELFLENRERRILRRIRRLQNKQKAHYSSKRSEDITKLRKKFHQRLNRAARAASSHRQRQYLDAIENNDMVETFNWIKQSAGTTRKSKAMGPIRKIDGSMAVGEKEKAETMALHFSSLAIDGSGHSKDANSWRHIIDDNLREAVRDVLDDPNFEAVEGRSTIPSKAILELDEVAKDFSKRVWERKECEWKDKSTVLEKANELARRTLILDQLSNEISLHELSEYLCNIARRKSPGPDGVTNEFLRCAIETKNSKDDKADTTMSPMLKCLHKAVNYAFRTATVPERWEKAIVTPVPKKGDLTDLNNYRGIALMSNIMKVINGIFAERLMKCIMEYRLIDPAQVGFVNREEAVAQAKCLVEILDRRRVTRKNTILCFVDLAKAYDSVPHEGLLAKTERFGISGIALNWLKAIYKSPKVMCRDGMGGFSGAQPYDRGVRQGDPLSPALFDIFMDDLMCQELHNLGVDIKVDPAYVGSNGLQKLAALLYADDIVLMADSVEKVQMQCDILTKWCDRNEMRVNAAKCGIMVFNFTGDLDLQGSDEKISIQGSTIPKVNSYTYLGVEIDTNLSEETMIKKRIEVCKRTILDYQRFLSSNRVPLTAKTTCIRAIIQPTLTYGAEIWGFSRERVQIAESTMYEAIRSCLRLPRSVSRFMMMQEFGLRSIYEISCVARARLQYKMQVLHGWLPKVVSAPLKTPRGITPRLRATSEKIWISKRDIPAKLLLHKKMLVESKEALMKRERSEQRDESIRILSKKIEDVIRDGLKTIMRKFAAPKPNEESAAETRYASKAGAKVTRRFLRQLEMERTDISYGWVVLERVRLGRYWTADKLVSARLIGSEYKSKCPFCKIDQPETAAHMILDCSAWKLERACTLDEILSKHNNNLITGLDFEARLALTNLTGLDAVDVVKMNHERVEERMLAQVSISDDDETSKQWLYQIATNLARFLSRVSVKRFKTLDQRGSFLNQATIVRKDT